MSAKNLKKLQLPHNFAAAAAAAMIQAKKKKKIISWHLK
jgi:hypothetical protein